MGKDDPAGPDHERLDRSACMRLRQKHTAHAKQRLDNQSPSGPDLGDGRPEGVCMDEWVHVLGTYVPSDSR